MSKSVNNNPVFFLVAVLIAGIIAISFQSFIDIEASGDKRGDHHNKHKDYRSNDPSVIVKKITCNNFNVNINGLRMDISPDDIASELSAQAQTDNDNNNKYISANSLGNGERNNQYKDNHDFDGFIYICIDNINSQGSSASPPSVPPTDETTTDETTSDETTSDETTSDETTSDENGTSETTTTDEEEQQGSESESKDNVSGETPYIQIPPPTDVTPTDETPTDETTTEGTPYPPTPPSTETTTDETTTESEETVTLLKNFLANMRS